MSPLLAQLYTPSLELIFLIVAAIISLFLTAIVYRENPGSATNRVFSVLTLSTTFWLILTYVSRTPGLFYDSLVLHRLGIFFAAPMSATFFLLAHTIPSDTIRMRTGTFYAVVVSTLLMMLINISPYAFVDIVFSGGSSQPQPGIGLLPFAVLSTIFSILAVYWLVRRYRGSSGAEKSQQRLVLTGMLIMLSLIIATILMPILRFGSARFLVFSPLYALVFLGMTAFAITKYHLFNMKILVAQALTLTLGLIFFAKLFGEETLNARLIDGFALVFTAVFGYFLVKSVSREVAQREKIEIQGIELEKINRQQEALLHFISHEIKGYLTKNQAAFAGIVDGDYGQISNDLATMSRLALDDTRKGVSTIMDILDASNLKKGTVSYKKTDFNISTALREVVEELKPQTVERGIVMHLDAGNTSCVILGDEDKIRKHVLRNIIDNSIKYTPKGRVDVGITKEGGFAKITIKDTGVGITPDDMKKLFTEGGHGADSIHINVHSTGYGLFIAKTIVEAHGGTVRAESAGADKGSTFTVTFPLAHR
jgi:signal transduction histidine kinase